MKLLTIGLLLLLALVQAELWAGKGGRSYVVQLQSQVQAQQQANDTSRLRNQRLAAEVNDLMTSVLEKVLSGRAQAAVALPEAARRVRDITREP